MALTLGLSPVYTANKWLDIVGGASQSVAATVYVKLHTAIPGLTGTNGASAETTRKQVTWSAASAGTKSMSGTLSWTSWAAGSETISHISLWDNVSAGNMLWSGALSSPKAVANGDTLNITSLTLAVTPLSAD
jgi:hypothetical protein